MHICKLDKSTSTIYGIANKKEKEKLAKKKQKEEEKKKQKEKENQNPQHRDYNLNQMNVRPWHNNRGGTNYNLSRLQNNQRGDNGLPRGLPQDMYKNKDNNFRKGTFKKNSKDQRLPSTRGGVKAPVITIEHNRNTKEAQLCLRGSTKFTNCCFGEACNFFHLEEGDLNKVKKGKKDIATFQIAYKETLSFTNKEEGEAAKGGD